MKKIIFTVILALGLTACKTGQMFTSNDLTQDGIRYKYGSSRGMKVGDKIIAYNKRPGRRGWAYDRLGTLTVSKVEDDQSYLKKDSDFFINESTAFFKE